ncbi:hypothetical protein IWW36_001639 [Coemansia brasiliensis]|uniref:Uncharacterized protein n=1 Tax=Coemansia brasiliensis TaxID=2650707 RepID=A0A9W8IEZ1_9FUNG|nr:hypothetical protein IWW36_001639 [Coemansia brasiliensis]
MTDKASEQRIYELETALSQQREANAQAQRLLQRLERDHQRSLDELEALHKKHDRLEQQFFAAESELAAAHGKLERMQRSNAVLEANIESKAAAHEAEREEWQRTEADLRTELAAAKRQAVMRRRQTVAAGSPPPVSTHSRTKSLYAHDVPGSTLLSPLASPRTLPPDTDEQKQQQQQQVRQLTRRLREAEARAHEATEQARRMHAEAEQALADLDASRQQAKSLEHTAQQLSELNESLREDNESYQMLLQMSTIKGGLSFSNARTSLDSRASSGKWAASPTIHDDGSPEAPPAVPGDAGVDLASELGQALSLDDASSSAVSTGSASGGLQARVADLEEQTTQLKEELRKTKYERRHLSEENKALSLYVNKILDRIMTSAGGLEAVLSHDYDPKRPTAAAAAAAAAPRSKHARHSSVRLVRKQPKEPAAQLLPLAPSAEPGSGDGITSVFVPPVSPATLRSAKPLPAEPPAFARRARSATVAAGTPSHSGPTSGAATISTAGGGTWWKRMSIRLGGSNGSWNAPAEEATASP